MTGLRYAALLGVCLWGQLGSAASPPPNLLFIFADDQAFDTIRALGNHEIETPNLDELVRRGTTFRHAYNMGSWSGAVCVASRTMLNTGRFIWDAHRIYKSCDQEREAGRFWSAHLRRAGYETYMSGKWHLPADAQKAFDYVRHVRPGMPNQTPEGYDRPKPGQADVWQPWDRSRQGFWKGGTHWSEVLAQDAVEFLQQAAQRQPPFFMYLAFNAPHDPRQSPQEFVECYPLDKISVPENFLTAYPFKDKIGCGPGLRDERLAPFPRTPHAVQVHRQEYYALITHMDQQIGRILQALEATGKADNTYIIFAADHGLAVGHHGLLGKQNLYEHSTRVPLIVVGPDVPAGAIVDTPVYLQDVMPTTLELAELERPDHVQFHSLLPLLRGESVQPYEAIYGAYLDLQRSITLDGYKLILYPQAQRARLYHLEKDPLEMHDLIDDPAARPLAKRLFQRLLQLQQELHDSLELEETFRSL